MTKHSLTTSRIKIDHAALLGLNILGHQPRIMPGPHNAGPDFDRAYIMIRQGAANLTRRPATPLVLSIYRQLQLAYNFHHVWPTHFAP